MEMEIDSLKQFIPEESRIFMLWSLSEPFRHPESESDRLTVIVRLLDKGHKNFDKQ